MNGSVLSLVAMSGMLYEECWYRVRQGGAGHGVPRVPGWTQYMAQYAPSTDPVRTQYMTEPGQTKDSVIRL